MQNYKFKITFLNYINLCGVSTALYFDISNNSIDDINNWNSKQTAKGKKTSSCVIIT